MTTKSKYVSHDKEKQTLKLVGEATTETMTWNDYLEVKFRKFTWQIPIKAEFKECSITKLGFAKLSSIVSYDLG